MRPRSWAAGNEYTATAFTPPSVTNSVVASGDSATAVGARPMLRSRNGAMVIVLVTTSRRVSMTLTASELPLAT